MLLRDHPLPGMVSTGLHYDRLLDVLVPPIEERDACLFSLYNWTEWQRLEVSERAACIAHYRVHHLIQLHQQDAIHREMERRNEQSRRG